MNLIPHETVAKGRSELWLDRPVPQNIVDALLRSRPRPRDFWLVDHATMEKPEMRGYNPSIIRHQGRLIMSYRRHCLRDLGPEGSSTASEVVLCDVADDLRTLSNHRVVGGLHGPHSEDCRLFHHADQLHLSYTASRYLVGGGWECSMQVAMFDAKGAHAHYSSAFGLNGVMHEKNWTYFSHPEGLRFIYQIEPFIVFEVGTRRSWSHRHLGEWVFGVPHGGTPPVKVGDLWFSFFHSYRLDLDHKRRYFVGAYAFDDSMRVRMFTPWPILMAHEEDGFIFDAANSIWHPLVTFPCGAIMENNTWTVSVGINDSYSGMFRVGHEELLNTHLRHVGKS